MALLSADKPEIPVGVLFSLTGPYRTVGDEMRNGTLLAIEEVNSSPDFDFRLAPEVEDPGGQLDQYRARCENLLKTRGVSHVIGCYTSSSRKEVIPIIEKYDALLWYPSHYEGFESTNNVIYTGASPNQHIVPLAAYALQNYKPEVYCVGSNYIWAWENNRIMREIVSEFGGRVVKERYLPVGSLDLDGIIAEIGEAKPGFIFNTLIGESSYAFYRAYYEAGEIDPQFDPSIMPVASCSLSEPELVSIGDPAAIGHITSSVYFGTIKSPENRDFVDRYKARFGHDRVTSADAEASYMAAMMLAMAIRMAGTTEIEQVKQALYRCRLRAPQGLVSIDPDNRHAYLTPRLGRSVANGRFSIFATAKSPIKPDPYMVWFDAAQIVAGSFRPAQGSEHQGDSGFTGRERLRLVK